MHFNRDVAAANRSPATAGKCRRLELTPQISSLSDLTVLNTRAAVSASLRGLALSPVTALHAPKAWAFGDERDGVIEMAAITGERGAIELGYYFGETKPKSIIKISAQVGCPASCRFCEVGEERFQRNLTAAELYEQAVLMAQVAVGGPFALPDKPHKVSFAGTGEPLLNPNLAAGLELIGRHGVSFKVSTILPSARACFENFERVAHFASQYPHSVQIQISLISTSEEHRRKTAGIKLATFAEIRELGALWRRYHPRREQINLSLIIADDTPADVAAVREIFPPEHFRFRFRNYVGTENGAEHKLAVVSASRFAAIKEQFRLVGYYVSDDATPTPTEMEFKLASNVTRRRMMVSLGVPLELKR